MAGDDGGVFWVGQPLTRMGDGSRAQMAADGGSVIFGDNRGPKWEKSRAQLDDIKKRLGWFWKCGF